MLHHIDGYVALAGLLVGFTVGLTGMGGGALMTPILVLLFKVQPLAAVSSDLVAAVVMKPIGGAVHLRRGTVNKRLVGWLAAGSVPSAFAGVLILRALGNGTAVQNHIKMALGVALLVAVSTMIARAFLNTRRRAVKGLGIVDDPAGVSDHAPEVVVRPLPTLMVGVLGGLLVGMTSVGSGSLIIVMLLLLYPQLKASELVGTDLIQAVPLVASAALGHILFGDFKLDLTASLLIGSVPGVYIGARVSAIAPGRVIRRALAFVLTASALKLLNMGNVEVAVLLGAAVVAGPLAWRFVRATGGLRRGWPPAAVGAPATGEEIPADLLPVASAGPAPAPQPAELAGQGR
ncbi:MAG TPA: sulfite exporter TauE/SafE family protein [Acidimicrobiia bacterium]|nr:sulfite exporter TauE/SafE family protein [Acidimicrobiia bacterium]